MSPRDGTASRPVSDADIGKSETSVHSIADLPDPIVPAEVIPVSPTVPVKDGGIRAWLQIIGAFFVFTNVWGFTFAFGSFQSYYETDYLPNQSASTLAWIGTISTFLLILTGVISGPLFDRGYFRSMLLGGAMMATLGVFFMSLSTKYWQLMLTQGVMMGLGNGLLYLPGLALVSRSFEKHRSIAMGITTCGAPMGGIIYTLIFEQLISRLGFAWTIRVMGFTMLGSFSLSFPLILFRATNLGDLSTGSAPRKLFDRNALTSAPFWAWSLSMFFILCGYIVPFAFIPSYAQIVLGLSRSLALQILLVSQATSIPGRLIAAYTASRYGVMIPWIISVSVSGIVCFAWYAARDASSLYAIGALFGLFSGPLIPLPPTVFARVCPDPKVFGAQLGMAQVMNSIGNLIGAPVAAAAATASSSASTTSYLGLQAFSGSVLMVGAIGTGWLWVELVKRRPAGSSIFI